MEAGAPSLATCVCVRIHNFIIEHLALRECQLLRPLYPDLNSLSQISLTGAALGINGQTEL
jgi:hypothetical protein